MNKEISRQECDIIKNNVKDYAAIAYDHHNMIKKPETRYQPTRREKQTFILREDEINDDIVTKDIQYGQATMV